MKNDRGDSTAKGQIRWRILKNLTDAATCSGNKAHESWEPGKHAVELVPSICSVLGDVDEKDAVPSG
jgi:hypothetical protein